MTLHADAERCFMPCSRAATCARAVLGEGFDTAPQYPSGPDCHGYIQKDRTDE